MTEKGRSEYNNKPMIHVDADACPVAVRKIIERIAERKQIKLVFYSDHNHELFPLYGQFRQVGQGKEAVDMYLIAQVKENDLVVTQDYGLAALALAKKAKAIHPSGRIFTDENIDRLLFERHLAAKARQAGQRMFSPKKRKTAEDRSFSEQLSRLVKDWPKADH